MPPPLLYSTNVALKFLIQERFRKNLHFAWCSEYFDAKHYPPYSIKSHVAPSANPYDIYRELKDAVARNDRHCSKINEQKVTFKNLALEWEAGGEISHAEKEEIIFWTDNAGFNEWRPLIYVIPRSLVELRLELVAPDTRASFGSEYVIRDLRKDEFNIIEI
jgi:hypothetical protein